MTSAVAGFACLLEALAEQGHVALAEQGHVAPLT
jgi:hypothetical protein